MYCKWCGMDSNDNMKCEWCGRPFAQSTGQPVPPAGVQTSRQTNADSTTYRPNMPPPAPVFNTPTAEPSAPITHQTLSAPVQEPLVYIPKKAEEETAPPSPFPGSPAPGVGPEQTAAIPGVSPTPPNVTSAMPYQTMAMQPAPGAPARPHPVGDELIDLGVPFLFRMERYLGITAILLTIGMIFAHGSQDLWWVPLYALIFFSGLWMGITRVVGYFDDNYKGVAIFIVATGIVGPAYAILVYLLVSMMMQETNYSLVGLMAGFLVIRLALGFAAHGPADTINYVFGFSLSFDLLVITVKMFPICVLFAGWMCASFSAPLNE